MYFTIWSDNLPALDSRSRKLPTCCSGSILDIRHSARSPCSNMGTCSGYSSLSSLQMVLLLLFALSANFVMGAGVPTTDAIPRGDHQGSPWHGSPFYANSSVALIQHEASTSGSRGFTARWMRRSTRKASPILLFSVIAVALATTFMILRCFRALAAGQGRTASVRNLGDDAGDESNNCDVSRELCRWRAQASWVALMGYA